MSVVVGGRSSADWRPSTTARIACRLRKVRLRIFVGLAALALLAAGAQVAWSRASGGARASASFRLVKVASGLSSPVYVDLGARRQAAVRGRAGRHHPHRASRQGGGHALRRSARLRPVGRRAGAALGCVLAGLREERQALRLLHEQGGQRGRLGAARAQGRRERPARSSPAAGDPGHGVQPQRRSAASSGPTGCSTSATATAGAAATGTARTATGRTPASCSASCCASTSRRAATASLRHPQGQPVRRPVGLASRDLGARPAQPVAVLVRPRQRRSLDRRRRSERVGRGRPSQARPRRHQLRLEPLRGPP